MQVDKVIQAIVNCPVGAVAKEEAARLCGAWIDKASTWPDTDLETVGVEVLWHIQLEPKTIIVGVIDKISRDKFGYLFSEWKTRRAPKIKKDGTPYLGDTEDDWLAEISQGVQLSTYALGAKKGKFLLDEEWKTLEQAGEPRILVRAAVKSTPPQIWPSNPAKGTFAFPNGVLQATESALLVMASSLRGAHKLNVTPWMMTGYQCKAYNRVCEHYETRCKVHLHPPITPVSWQHKDAASPDPGYKVCELLGLDINDPELVVLSQSAYQTYSRCLEKGRIEYGGHVLGEASYELEVGSCFHAGLAAFNMGEK